MGAGFTKEQANLPFAVSSFSPAQRRSPAADNLPQPSGEPPSSAVAPEDPVGTAQKLSPFARLRARRRTIAADATFDEQSSWWNEVTESDDDDDDEYDDQGEDGSSETNNDQVVAETERHLPRSESNPPELSGSSLPATRASGRKPKTRQKLYPYAFSELPSFTNINLCSSGIVKLSPNIGILQGASSIQLCCNSLTSLPASITNLRNLTHLDLSNNQLTSLPASLGCLEKLLELRVSSNQLTHLPPTIKSLTCLQILAVSYNKLSELPSEMGALSALVDLDIAGNPKIRWLPAEIGRLKFLRRIRCTGCGLLRKEDVLAEELKRSEQVATSPVLSLREMCARTILRIDPLYHTLFPTPSRSETYPRHTRSSSATSSSSTFNLYDIPSHHQLQPSRSGQRMSIIESWKFRKSFSTSSLSSLSSPFFPPTSTSPSETPKTRRRGKQAQQPAQLEPVPASVLNYLESAHRCTFCGGPFLESYVSKFRFVPAKGLEVDEREGDEDDGNTENRLPLEYRLCINHWNDENGRIRAMFSPLPSTAPGRSQSTGFNRTAAGNLAATGAAAGSTSFMRRSQSGVLMGLGRDRRESADGNVIASQSSPHSRSTSSSSSLSSTVSGSTSNRKRSVLSFREFKSYVLGKSRSGGLDRNNEGETPPPPPPNDR